MKHLSTATAYNVSISRQHNIANMGESQSLFAVTISTNRKPGMGEDDYHQYTSEIHSGHLKHLLVKNKIVDYTMVCPGMSLQFQFHAKLTSWGSNKTRPER